MSIEYLKLYWIPEFKIINKKNQNFLIWSYRIFVFLFISFRWQKSDKNPTLIVAKPLTFMHSLPLNWHKNVQKDRQTGGQTVFKTKYQEDKKPLQREEVILLVSFSIWCILNALFHGNINMLHLLSSSSVARQTGRQTARLFGGKSHPTKQHLYVVMAQQAFSQAIRPSDFLDEVLLHLGFA